MSRNPGGLRGKSMQRAEPGAGGAQSRHSLVATAPEKPDCEGVGFGFVFLFFLVFFF